MNYPLLKKNLKLLLICFAITFASWLCWGIRTVLCVQGCWLAVGIIAALEEVLTLGALAYVVIDKSYWGAAGLVAGAAVGAALATAFNIS